MKRCALWAIGAALAWVLLVGIMAEDPGDQGIIGGRANGDYSIK